MLLLALVFLVVTSFLVGITIEDAYGLVQIKKYKVVNSPEVCGDKLCPKPSTEKSKSTSSQDSEKKSKPTIKTAIKTINEKKFLWFEGDGWHGFHNVAITISGNYFSTTINSKTTSRGHLLVPWQIPQSLTEQELDVFATDELNELKTTVTIGSVTTKQTSFGGTGKCAQTRPPIDWSGCNLYGKVLKDIDLRNASLRNTNLFGSTLSNMDLSGSDLSYAFLKKANLDGVRLVGSNLSYSNLADAKIRNADLRFAKIQHSYLVDTDFTNSNLSWTDFRNSILSYSILAFTDLNGSNLNFTGMWGANLNHCRNHPICTK